MSVKRNRIMTRILLGAGALCLFQGCVTLLPLGYELKIRLQDELLNQSGHFPPIQVHVAGLNYQEAERWANISMTRYWQPHGERPPHAYSMNLGGTQNREQILHLSDPIWRQWERAGAIYLFVLADLPGVFDDKPESKDARRLIVPLDRKRWPSRSIEIGIWKEKITHWPSLIHGTQ